MSTQPEFRYVACYAVRCQPADLAGHRVPSGKRVAQLGMRQRANDWGSTCLEVFVRTLLLFYLVACLRVLAFTCRLQPRAPRTNRRIRTCRDALRGAPFWLAFGIVAHLLPVGAGMRATSADPYPLVAGQRVAPGAYEPVHDAQVAATAGSLPRHHTGDPKFCVSVFSYQAAAFHTAIWIDPGDSESFVLSKVQDAVYFGEQGSFVQVCPQPAVGAATFLDVPAWALRELLVPVFIEVLSARPHRYLEVFRGRVDAEDIRLAVGHKWIPGGRIFVGDATEPLALGQIAQLQPGTLVRVVPRGCPLTRCATLAVKIRRPRSWFRVEGHHPLEEHDDPPGHIGLLGVMGDWTTIPASSLTGVPSLQDALQNHCGRPAHDFAYVAPSTHLPNLCFRGDRVSSLLAIVPPAVSSCCVMFVDARDLLLPVTALILPFAVTTLEHVLRLAGGSRPAGVPLRIEGVGPFDPDGERFVPRHKAVLRVTVCEVPPDSDNGSYLPVPRRRVAAAMAGSVCHSISTPDLSSVCDRAPKADRPSQDDTKICCSPVFAQPVTDLHDTAQVHEQAPALPVLPAADEGIPIGHMGDGTDVPEDAESEPVVPSPSLSLRTWRIPVRILHFQQQETYSVLWVGEGEPLGDVLTRAQIIFGHAEIAHEVLVPDPQPMRRMLTVVVAPRWWRDRGMHAVLIAMCDGLGGDFVAVFNHGVTVPDLLPPAGHWSESRVDVYHSGGDVEAGEEAAPGALFFVQRAGAARPDLPSPREIIFDSGLDCPEGQLPSLEPPPHMRYLALGEGFEQTLVDLEYGPVTPQVASAVGTSAVDTAVWFPKGSDVDFGCISVQGRIAKRLLGYRPHRVAAGDPRHVLFLDARTLGKPVCCRLYSQTIFCVEDLLESLDVYLSERYTARFFGRGADPLDGDPLVKRVHHCAVVTIQVAHVEPMGSPTTDGLDSAEDPASDADDAQGPDGPSRTGSLPSDAPGFSPDPSRSRSPRRPMPRHGSQRPSGPVDSVYGTYNDGLHAVSPCQYRGPMWKKGSTEDVLPERHPSDTPEHHGCLDQGRDTFGQERVPIVQPLPPHGEVGASRPIPTPCRSHEGLHFPG